VLARVAGRIGGSVPFDRPSLTRPKKTPLGERGVGRLLVWRSVVLVVIRFAHGIRRTVGLHSGSVLSYFSYPVASLPFAAFAAAAK
jgi:hypothetical protein